MLGSDELFEDEPGNLKDKFAKATLAMLAAFAAEQLVRKAYDVFIIARRSS